jgi:hypothetical protein
MMGPFLVGLAVVAWLALLLVTHHLWRIFEAMEALHAALERIAVALERKRY